MEGDFPSSELSKRNSKRNSKKPENDSELPFFNEKSELENDEENKNDLQSKLIRFNQQYLKPFFEALYQIIKFLFEFLYNELKNRYDRFRSNEGFKYGGNAYRFYFQKFVFEYGRASILFLVMISIIVLLYFNRFSLKKIIEVDAFYDSQGRVIIEPFLFWDDPFKEDWTHIGDINDDEFIKWFALSKKKKTNVLKEIDISNGFTFTQVMGLQEKRNVSFEILENEMKTLLKASSKPLCLSSFNFGLSFFSVLFSRKDLNSSELLISPKITKWDYKKQKAKLSFPENFDSIEVFKQFQEEDNENQYSESGLHLSKTTYEKIYPSEIFVEWFSPRKNSEEIFERSGYFSMEEAACICFMSDFREKGY